MTFVSLFKNFTIHGRLHNDHLVWQPWPEGWTRRVRPSGTAPCVAQHLTSSLASSAAKLGVFLEWIKAHSKESSDPCAPWWGEFFWGQANLEAAALTLSFSFSIWGCPRRHYPQGSWNKWGKYKSAGEKHLDGRGKGKFCRQITPHSLTGIAKKITNFQPRNQGKPPFPLPPLTNKIDLYIAS